LPQLKLHKITIVFGDLGYIPARKSDFPWEAFPPVRKPVVSVMPAVWSNLSALAGPQACGLGPAAGGTETGAGERRTEQI